MRRILPEWLAWAVLIAIPFPGHGAEAVAGTESFFIELPGDGIAVTHGGDLALGAGPGGIPLLSEALISDGLAMLAKLRDESGTVIGFVSELEVFPADADMLGGDVVWDTVWTLMIPGRGALFLSQQEHSGELGARVVNPVLTTGEPWRGEWTVTTTVGPGAGGSGLIGGGTGEFAGRAGGFVEIVTLTGFDPPGILTGRVELRLEFEPRP